MNDIDRNIMEWKLKFHKYMIALDNCRNNINAIKIQKENFKQIQNNIVSDDAQFYMAIVDNSVEYFSKSIIIRRKKFCVDLNSFWETLAQNKRFETLNEQDFQELLNDLKKKIDSVNQLKKNNPDLPWLKENINLNNVELEKRLNNILDYHYGIIQFIQSETELEKIFYVGRI